MREKITTAILIVSVFFCGMFSDRILGRIRAATWSGLVQTVNSVSPDNTGNVDVTTVNGYTVDSSVPSTANFDQYNLNGTEIGTINTALNDLTATAEDVALGKSAIIHGGARVISEEEFDQLPYCTVNWGDDMVIGDGSPCVIRGGFDTSAASVTVAENVYAPRNSSSLFSSLRTSNWNIGNLHTEYVEDMSYMFYRCDDITTLDLSNFNTANVTNMSHMFDDCINLTSLNLSSFNTENVTDMSCMFSECQSLTAIDLSNFNTANVTNMGDMFCDCEDCENIYVGSLWSTDAVTDSSNMFYECTKLPNFDSSVIDKTNAHTGAGGYLTLK